MRISKSILASERDYDAWIRLIKERVQRAFAKVWRRDEIVQAPLGQLPWLLSSVNGKTIGMVFYHLRNDFFAEYALADLNNPIGVSIYQLGLPSPKQLQVKLQKILVAPTRTKKGGVK